ncbi:unnamed protein product [Oikopleura dioica]|uniref:Uncharacterized protein n=1 Tax=Oikopleura dioica TaxID=34765 RepID=E4YZK7_OIKDI|nr:unnamed protein product [Oikopleura dioica]
MENTRYGGHMTTDVLREAREALSTSRPETPRINLMDLQESFSGRRTPRIIQNERRPKTGSLQTRPSRLQPIGAIEPPSPDLLRSVSVVSSLEANSTGLTQFVKTMISVNDAKTYQNC